MRKIRYIQHFLSGTFALLLVALCSACSDNTIGTEEIPESKPASISFHINGIDEMPVTRAGKVSGQNIFKKYVVKLCLFAEEKNTGGGPTNPYPTATLVDGYPKDITTANVTIELPDITTYNYLYTFIACEKAYKDKLVVQELNPEEEYEAVWRDATSGSLYTNCSILVLDAENQKTFEKAPEAGDYFMVYGFGEGITTVSDENVSYYPKSIVLTRQMGAVVFSTGNIAQQAECSVFTEFYRLYLSQMVEKGPQSAGTRNHAHNGEYGINGTDSANPNENPEVNPYAYGDYAGMVIGKNKCSFTQSFTQGTTVGTGDQQISGYVMYLPCTTVRQKDIPEQEYANVSFAGGNPATSITTGSKTYSTSTKFPIYPNRRTILTIGDGSTLDVSFSEADSGINYEDDWNGGLVNN